MSLPPISPYSYLFLENDSITTHSNAIANLRISVFREYPYCYVGSAEIERLYLESYSTIPGSLIIIAIYANKVAGAITGMPLKEAPSDYRKPIASPDQCYYLGDILVLKEYRSQGIGAHLYTLFEERIKEKNNGYYKSIVAREVVKQDGDPRRPANYRDLDVFWQHRGFVLRRDLISTDSWPEVDRGPFLEHDMSYLVKTL